MSNDNYTGRNLYRVEVDATRVNELLKRLNDKEAKKAISSALRKSILIIRKQAQENLVSAVNDAEFSSSKNGVSFKPLKNEINVAVYRNASGARVDLIDRRKKGSRAYMLKWFESGTKERFTKESSTRSFWTNKKRVTKKAAYRGIINASHFFSNAVKSKQKEAENSLEKNIIDSIMKVANKKEMSLSIGAHVYKRLSDSTELAKLVSDKIYAISTKTETSFPFVIYKRNSLTPEYTKDRYGTGDTVSVEIVVVSDNYLNSVTIAEEVRKSLENKRGSYDNFDVIDSKLISANEDFIEDTFIQSLVFSFKTE